VYSLKATATCKVALHTRNHQSFADPDGHIDDAQAIGDEDEEGERGHASKGKNARYCL